MTEHVEDRSGRKTVVVKRDAVPQGDAANVIASLQQRLAALEAALDRHIPNWRKGS